MRRPSADTRSAHLPGRCVLPPRRGVGGKCGSTHSARELRGQLQTSLWPSRRCEALPNEQRSARGVPPSIDTSQSSRIGPPTTRPTRRRRIRCGRVVAAVAGAASARPGGLVQPRPRLNQPMDHPHAR
eukprot:218839-Chlamydomonas_euryale.AAC.4